MLELMKENKKPLTTYIELYQRKEQVHARSVLPLIVGCSCGGGSCGVAVVVVHVGG